MSKKTIFVGNLSQEVSKEILHAAFIAFGDIFSIQLPIDSSSRKNPPEHRGYAFIEFEEEQDAVESIDNMDQSELYGRTIKVTTAKAMKITEGGDKAIWAQEEYLKEQSGVVDEENIE